MVSVANLTLIFSSIVYAFLFFAYKVEFLLWSPGLAATSGTSLDDPLIEVSDMVLFSNWL